MCVHASGPSADRPTDRCRALLCVAVLWVWFTSGLLRSVRQVTKKLKDENVLRIPLVATNRINTPERLEEVPRCPTYPSKLCPT